MKTKLLLIGVVFGTAVILSSCNKATIAPPDENAGTMNFDQTKSEINALVAKYPPSNHKTPVWLGTALADAGGAWRGGVEGSEFGPWGTGAGAVLGGVFASLCYGTATGVRVTSLPPSVVTSKFYDQIGDMHNSILFYLMNSDYSKGNQIDTLVVFNTIKVQLVNDWNALEYDKKSVDDIHVDYSQFVNYCNEGIEFANTRNVNLLTNDIQARFVLGLYVNTVSNLDNKYLVNVFTTAYSAIVQQSAIASPTKQGILVFLTVYNHSFSYWNNK
ncbi:MAG: hypothetical protein ABI199_06040 [Bacteroidia bacterium]